MTAKLHIPSRPPTHAPLGRIQKIVRMTLCEYLYGRVGAMSYHDHLTREEERELIGDGT